MIWAKSFTTLVLVASFPLLGSSRAVPSISRTCDDRDCNDDASGLESFSANLISRFEDRANHTFDGLTILWSRQEHQLFGSRGTRVVSLNDPKEARAVSPTKPRPSSSKPNSSDNPFAPLDPTKPSDTGTDPDDNPFAPLDPARPSSTPPAPDDNSPEEPDPTQPKSSNAPSASPSNRPDSADGGSGSSPDDGDTVPAEQPTTGASSCGLKRANCSPSDNIGDDVPGQAPDTVADTRRNRPADDSIVEYDYLAEVRSEKDRTDLVNEKLANLRNKIATGTPDDVVRLDEINQKYAFDSKNPLPNNQAQIDQALKDEADAKTKAEAEGKKAEKITIPDPEIDPFEYEDVLGKRGGLDHEDFDKLLKAAGVTLTDSRGDREALRSNEASAQTLRLSWSRDQKVLFTDWSYKKFDASDMSPKPHFTELTMAIFREKGVDAKNIQAIGQTRISNDSTMKTIDSIFESLKPPKGTSELVLLAADADEAKRQAFDAYFRTANGKGTVNTLAFHAGEFGRRNIKALVLQRPVIGAAKKHQSLVVLE